MSQHPTVSSPYPPSEDSLANHFMLKVALGLQSRDTILEEFEELLDLGEFDEAYPDQEAPSLEQGEALLDEVIALHNGLVTQESPDQSAFLHATGELAGQGIITSMAGSDLSEAFEVGQELAEYFIEQGATVLGLVVSHSQDHSRLIQDGSLYLGYQAWPGSGVDDLEVGRRAAQAYADAGLTVNWNGELDHRIELVDLLWAAPYDPSPDEDDEDDED